MWVLWWPIDFKVSCSVGWRPGGHGVALACFVPVEAFADAGTQMHGCMVHRACAWWATLRALGLSPLCNPCGWCSGQAADTARQPKVCIRIAFLQIHPAGSHGLNPQRPAPCDSAIIEA